MADNSVIKEFLVRLGWSIDGEGMKRFARAIGDVTKRAAQLGAAIEAAGLAVDTAAVKMADRLEQLYYAAQRAGTTVSKLESLSFAARQIGLQAGDAKSALEGLGRALRTNPGNEGVLRSLGVRTREANGQLRDTGKLFDDLSERLDKMPHWLGAQYAEMLGISEEALFQMRKNRSELQRSEKFARDLAKRAGVDLDASAEKSVAFMKSLRELGLVFETLWTKVSTTLIDKLGPDITKLRDLMLANFDKFAGALEKTLGLLVQVASFMGEGFFKGAAFLIEKLEWLDVKTSGWSTAILGLVVAWKALNLAFIATPAGAALALITAFAALTADYLTWQETSKVGLVDWAKWEPGIKKVVDAIGWIRAQWEWFNSNVLGVTGADSPNKWTGMTPRQMAWAGGSPYEGDAVGGAPEMMERFKKRGWTPEQAAGIAAAAKGESGFDPTAVNPTSGARGLFQWLGKDKYDEYAKWSGGKNLADASGMEQEDFLHYQLTQGSERAAGKKLRDARDSRQASAAMDGFERYGGWDNMLNPEVMKRANDASSMLRRDGGYAGSTKTGDGPVINQTTTVNVSGSSDPASTAAAVAGEQGRVNGDMIRNMRGALR